MGATADGDDPTNAAGASVDINMSFTSGDATAAVDALNSDTSLQDSFVGLVSGENDADFTFVSAAVTLKQGTDFTVVMKLVNQAVADYLNATSDTSFTVTVPDDSSFAALAPALADVVFDSQSVAQQDLGVVCTMKGVGGNSFTKPLCINSVRVVIAQQRAMIEDLIVDALPDYEVDNFGVESNGRFWISARYVANDRGYSQAQVLDCELTEDIDGASEDIQDKIDELLGSIGCSMSLANRNCKVLLTTTEGFKDYDEGSACASSCGTCPCEDDTTPLDDSSGTRYLSDIATINIASEAGDIERLFCA